MTSGRCLYSGTTFLDGEQKDMSTACVYQAMYACILCIIPNQSVYSNTSTIPGFLADRAIFPVINAVTVIQYNTVQAFLLLNFILSSSLCYTINILASFILKRKDIPKKKQRRKNHLSCLSLFMPPYV